MSAIVLGDLKFQVRRSDRRRTLGLTIERDGRLVLSAPTRATEPQLERFARDKRFWVYQKLAGKDALPPPAPPREFVTGEGLLYLGRSYRLQLVTDLDVPVKLEAGRFKMQRGVASTGRAALVRWYVEHGRPWIATRVERHRRRVRVSPSSVTVRDLGFRWGSCGQNGQLNFHWQVMLLPPRIVEYVVVHELVHLRLPHHTPTFWRAVERAMPDWESRRQWLAKRGSEFSL